MLRPFLILSFIGLSAALSSGCDRGNDVVDAESQLRGATLEPAVHAYDKDGNPEESGGTCAGS